LWLHSRPLIKKLRGTLKKFEKGARNPSGLAKGLDSPTEQRFTSLILGPPLTSALGPSRLSCRRQAAQTVLTNREAGEFLLTVFLATKGEPYADGYRFRTLFLRNKPIFRGLR